MAVLHWYDEKIEAPYIVNGGDKIIFYDENYNKISVIDSISYRDLPHIFISDGEFMHDSDIPSTRLVLQASIDYLDMQTESLEVSDEANRADIDYCLMMLDDGVTDGTTTEETDTTVTDSTTEDGDTTDEQLG